MQVQISRVAWLIVLIGVSYCLSAEAQPLPNNIPIDGTPYFENTAKVIPPGSTCPDGKIVVVTGERGSGRILHRPLRAADGSIDMTSPTGVAFFPTGSTRAVATDNQLVRLKDGSLLAVKDTFIWDPIPQNPPAWIGETVTGSGDHKGQRTGELFFRSTDCGETWTVHSVVDFGTFLDGKYGVPRPMGDPDGDGVDQADVAPAQQGQRPDGSLKWWVGGGDRTELYVCPFTGYVYVTTRVISGPYFESHPKRDTALLLYSKDNGQSWEAIREDLPGWAPLVMTSTPNGRLFVFQSIGSQPRVYFSQPLLNTIEKPLLGPGYDVGYVENGVSIPNGINPKEVDLFLQVFHPSLSRVSVDTTSSRIRAAYQSINADGMHETRIILIDVQGPNQPPIVTPVMTVSAEDPKNYSVLYFNFIDPDYLDTPPGFISNTSVAYWIEASRVGIPVKRYIKYLIFDGDTNTGCPAYLSVQDGLPRSWTTRYPAPRPDGPGDYLNGGFLWDDNALHYVAQWAEHAGVRANVLRLPYHAPGATLGLLPPVCAADVSVETEPGACVANASLRAPAAYAYGCPVTVSGSRADGLPLTAPFPKGATAVTWTATAGASSVSCTQNVIVGDAEAPTIGSVALDPPVLWPPNHKMVNVSAQYVVTDNCDATPAVACTLHVASNEPVSSPGSGNTAPDWQVISPWQLRLRAERRGAGTGRVYSVTVACTDQSGNSATRTAAVTVPNSR